MVEITVGKLTFRICAPVIVMRYHPLHKEIPKGWVMASDFGRFHHGQYSVLIRRLRRDYFYVLWGTK